MKSFTVLLFCCCLLVEGLAKHHVVSCRISLKDTLTSTLEKVIYESNPALINKGITLQCQMVRKSPAATYRLYQLHMNGFPIWQGYIRTVTDHSNQLRWIIYDYPDLDQYWPLSLSAPSPDMLSKDSLIHSSDQRDMKTLQQWVLVFDEKGARYMKQLDRWNRFMDSTLLLNMDNETEFAFSNLRYAGIDTPVQVQVFLPDPLTTLNQTYGGVYIDNSDAHNAWLDPAYQIKTVRATFDNLTQLFYPENNRVKLDDLEAPNIATVTSLTPAFIYTRDQSGFEDANVLYHITKFHDYISSLGYDTLMDLQLLVDAHAQSGADNSVFNRNGGNPNIMLGTGGVDDAEDADVIIHEYSHGLSWSANQNTVFSFERAGLDEGLADYFATSYSRSLNTNRWQDMFTWDGHNQFWAGRTAVTGNLYPSTSPSFYTVGEIWNAALSQIWGDLGAIVTDKLMLESLHFFTNTTTLPQAAHAIMMADTLLFGGMHATALCSRFQARNLLDVSCMPVAVTKLSKPSSVLLNTYGFAHAQEDAIFRPGHPESGQLLLMNMHGQLIRRYTTQGLPVTISPFGLVPGIYSLVWQSAGELQRFRLQVGQ